MILTLMAIMFPVSFTVVILMAGCLITSYNKSCVYFYEKKVRGLQEKEKDLLRQLAEATGKKQD